MGAACDAVVKLKSIKQYFMSRDHVLRIVAQITFNITNFFYEQCTSIENGHQFIYFYWDYTECANAIELLLPLLQVTVVCLLMTARSPKQVGVGCNPNTDVKEVGSRLPDTKAVLRCRVAASVSGVSVRCDTDVTDTGAHAHKQFPPEPIPPHTLQPPVDVTAV